jgi:HlyD family type I secretion membrane fusion protein
MDTRQPAASPAAAALAPADLAGAARRLARIGALVVAAGMLAGVGWLAFAPLYGAVIAPAFVKVDNNRKTVQHQEGGIVRDILVRDGQKVEAGQLLLLLDDVRVGAGFELLEVQWLGERAREARLSAERESAPGVAFPPDVREAAARLPAVASSMQREQAVFVQRRQSLESQIALLRTQIAHTEDERSALLEQIKADENAVRLQREELAVNQALVEQKFIQRTRIIMLERALSDYESRLNENRSVLAKARQKISDLELRIVTQRNAYVQTAAEELKQSTARVNDLEQQLRPLRDASARQRIVAPVAGEVVGLRVFTRGAVIGPRDPLLDIVPADSHLVVEARIRPEDVSYIGAGSDVDVRFTAFKYRTTHVAKGTVRTVSGDRLIEEATGAPYYSTLIEVTADALAQAGGLNLQAGMPAEVFIRTTARTPLSYFFEPLTAYARRAFREP